MAFVQLANELGVWQVGPDGVPGLTVEGAAAVLEASGVPAAIVTGGGPRHAGRTTWPPVTA